MRLWRRTRSLSRFLLSRFLNGVSY